MILCQSPVARRNVHNSEETGNRTRRHQTRNPSRHRSRRARVVKHNRFDQARDVSRQEPFCENLGDAAGAHEPAKTTREAEPKNLTRLQTKESARVVFVCHSSKQVQQLSRTTHSDKWDYPFTKLLLAISPPHGFPVTSFDAWTAPSKRTTDTTMSVDMGTKNTPKKQKHRDCKTLVEKC